MPKQSEKTNAPAASRAPCRIKLCGLATETDVLCANDLQVWAVGFVLTESPRRIAPELCRQLAALVAPRILKIGVFRDEKPAAMRHLREDCGLDAVQAYGPYSPKEMAEFLALPGLPAFRIKQESDLSAIQAAFANAGASSGSGSESGNGCGSGHGSGTKHVNYAAAKRFFVDGGTPGSGETFDWSLARAATQFGEAILAGGLTPENVAAAIAQVRPWGVDVSSGIEKTRGQKDHALMQKFVAAVRLAANA